MPAMWLVGGHMSHGRDATRSWSAGERNDMIALMTGYLAVKLVAGVHAGYAAADFNRSAVSAASLVPLHRGALAGATFQF